jgi:hypothetical protein
MTGKQEIFYKAYTRLIYPVPGEPVFEGAGGKELPMKTTGFLKLRSSRRRGKVFQVFEHGQGIQFWVK